MFDIHVNHMVPSVESGWLTGKNRNLKIDKPKFKYELKHLLGVWGLAVLKLFTPLENACSWISN